MVSSMRYLSLARLMDDVPEEYWRATYGPANNTEDSTVPAETQTKREQQDASDARARAVAAEMRAAMAG